MTGLDHERKIRGKGTVVGSTGGLVVLVGAGKVVGELSGALLDLTLVVGLGIELVLLGKGLSLIDGHEVTDKVAVGNALERVAGSANLLVDLETSAEGLVVEGLVELLVLPRVLGGVKTVGPMVSAGWSSVYGVGGQHTPLRRGSWRGHHDRTGSSTMRRNRRRRRWQQRQWRWWPTAMTRHQRRKKQRAGGIETSARHDSTGNSRFGIDWRYRRVSGVVAYRGLAGCGVASSGGEARGSQAGSGQHGLRLTVSGERGEGGWRCVSNN